ncbi:hypothetical protein R3W88_011119 [Solanum pinnatisectum]|uniref:Uncharacterized protein n=1 Tax=Solanum pinnatisectum TaxID=50273 RepID=A0AAV9L5M6_9SOLN|nr:hypothetical protein R3W88_011119 [Solanum pinnatisectum]
MALDNSIDKCNLSKKQTSNFLKNSSSHHKRCAFTRKCANLVKEQRAKFYIMRRCVTMLICWRDYRDT